MVSGFVFHMFGLKMVIEIVSSHFSMTRGNFPGESTNFE